MLRDLSDAWGWLQRILRRLDRIESGAILENASITNGRLRIIGGTLRVDSGGSVVVVGTLSIDGITTVTGSFTVSGPWKLSGNGEITGNVTISGNVTSTGILTQNGPWNLNGPGKIAGTVEITGILTLLADLVVQGLGRIKIGTGMTLDPSSNGGSMKFSGGPEVYASGTTLSLYSGAITGAYVEIGPGLAKINGGGARWIEVTPSGFKLVGIQKVAKSGIPVGCLYKATDGFIYEG